VGSTVQFDPSIYPGLDQQGTLSQPSFKRPAQFIPQFIPVVPFDPAQFPAVTQPSFVANPSFHQGIPLRIDSSWITQAAVPPSFNAALYAAIYPHSYQLRSSFRPPARNIPDTTQWLTAPLNPPVGGSGWGLLLSGYRNRLVR
jgi:hypothetical protein